MRPVGYLVASQLSLLLGIIVCIAEMPHYLFERDEGGISNYGVHAATVVPYSLGLGLCAVFAWRAATGLGGVVAALLRVYAAGMLAVLISTYAYQSGPALLAVHVVVATVFEIAETALTIWLASVVLADSVGMALLVLELAAFVLAGLTLIGAMHVLFATQLALSVVFGVCVVRAANRVVPRTEERWLNR